MKNLYTLSLLLFATILSGCEAIGTIFKGGMWFGIILMGALILLVVFVISRSRK